LQVIVWGSQLPEQQSMSPVQLTPMPRQAVEQTPLLQMPEQHCPPLRQTSPTGKQAICPQTPLSQKLEQQSLLPVQVLPSDLQEAHRLVRGSQ